jgi:glucuronate isomerase
MNAKRLNEDRLFPADERTRQTARSLYSLVKNAPIISPHGHTDAGWFSENKAFQDPVTLLLTPDHYLLRMLYSQGIKLESLGVAGKNLTAESDKRKIWRLFAKNFYLFRGTPSALWLSHVFYEIFGLEKEFNESSADYFFDGISELLKTENFLPRKLFERFNIEVLATTDAATDSLSDHQKIRSEWGRRVIPTYRPDAAIDPEHEDFYSNISKLSELTKEDTSTWTGYLNAHRSRREFFKKAGATATDHGPVSPRTLFLSDAEAEKLFSRVMQRNVTADDAEKFRAHMLWQMAAMAADDGMVMQLHAGSYRNHNPWLFENFGRDKGADIPMQMEYTRNLKPLLDSFGNNANLKLILFTLDESTYSRELAPLAGHYPCLRLGPAWWFHDSPEGMIRHRKQTIETAGFYNVTGFIDDTRSFFSIPSRHDVSRRIDARILAELVAEHRLTEDEARDTIVAITTSHAKECFRL